MTYILKGGIIADLFNKSPSVENGEERLLSLPSFKPTLYRATIFSCFIRSWITRVPKFPLINLNQ